MLKLSPPDEARRQETILSLAHEANRVPLDVLVVTRHQGAIDWLQQYLGIPHDTEGIEVRTHVSEDDAWGRVVIGNVPLSVASAAAVVFAICFDGDAPRGNEWTAEQMFAAGAYLEAFRVRAVLHQVVCGKCHDVPDHSEHGRAYNLALRDDGCIGGQGPCGDCHEWIVVES